MFKRNVLPFIALLALLAVGAVTIHLIDVAGSIGPQTFRGFFAPQSAEAAGTTRYVDDSAIGAGTGASWADAFTTLQDALAAAVSGDQIWVASGVYYPDEGAGQVNNDRASTFMLIDGVELYGGFAGTETSLGQRSWVANVTVLSGDVEKNDTTDAYGVVTNVAYIHGLNAYHVVTGGGTGPSAVLDGFTLTAGQAEGTTYDGRGGGMFNNVSSPTLSNLIFAGNLATSHNGGGMYNYQSSPTMTDVSFTGNQTGTDGGGMYNYQSSPTLTNVSFTGNQAVDGGAMYNDQSSPTLTSVSFSGNYAQHGGGIYNYILSRPTLTNVSFNGNLVSSDGGAMYNAGYIYNPTAIRDPTLMNVSFIGNMAINSGGGIYSDTSDPILTNVTFSGNQAGYGGGMANYNSSNPTLINVSFTGNLANTSGGGMINNTNNPTLTNVSFSGNHASIFGGAMLNFESSPTLTNTILWNNLAGSSGDQIYNSSSTPVISYSDIQGSGGSGFGWDSALGTDGGNNLDADPIFITPVDPATAPTTAGDLHLQYGSPAIDTGNNGVCPPTDLDGVLRPIDGDSNGSAVCDMGAYEKLIDLFLPLIMR